MLDVHFLWIDDKPLSNLEIMCLKSHTNHSHSCTFWSYNTKLVVPNGINIRDANDIIPRDKIFTYKRSPFKNNLAGFSDLFRYKVLYEYGGWWCDTDVLCLKKFDFQQDYVFGTERRMNKTIGIAPAIIKCPIKSDFIKSCLEDAEKRLSINTNIAWGEIAHKLLQKHIKKYGLNKYMVDYRLFCPLDWFNAKLFFNANNSGVDVSLSYGIHLWNTVLKRNNIDKNIPITNSQFDHYLKINNVSIY